jgi:hypothetical protein
MTAFGDDAGQAAQDDLYPASLIHAATRSVHVAHANADPLN